MVAVLAGGLSHNPWGGKNYFDVGTVLIVQLGLGGFALLCALVAVYASVTALRGRRRRWLSPTGATLIAFGCAGFWLVGAAVIFGSS